MEWAADSALRVLHTPDDHVEPGWISRNLLRPTGARRPQWFAATHPGAIDVVAVNGNTDVLCLPGGGGGAMCTPESPGLSRLRYVNFQQTLPPVIVIVAVPDPVEVVRRYFPVRSAFRTTAFAGAAALGESSAASARETTSVGLITAGRFSDLALRASSRRWTDRGSFDLRLGPSYGPPIRQAFKVACASVH